MAVDVRNNRFSPCCHVTKKHFEEYTTIEEYENSEKLNKLQDSFRKNERNALCNYCWTNEDNNVQSMRQSVLQDRQHSDLDAITQIKLHTGSTCNLACMMCFPSVSSTWKKLWTETDPPEVFNKIAPELYDSETESYIKKNIAHIKYIETLGGEPLFSKRFLKLLNWIRSSGHSNNITLYIITNATLLTEHIFEVCKDFKKIVFTVSLEGVGKVNDYIRWGSSFENIDNNIRLLLEKKYSVAIVPTISSLNLHRIQEVYDYADKIGVPVMNASPVEGWKSLLPANLPIFLQGHVPLAFKKFLSDSPNETALKQFITNWDKQRNTSILDYMPEFNELMV